MKTKLELLSEELLQTQQKLIEVEENFNKRIEDLIIYFKKMINEK